MQRALGIIGGLGRLGNIDVQACIRCQLESGMRNDRRTLLFQQSSEVDSIVEPRQRKLYVHDMAQRLRQRGATSILLPCFISQTFLSELQPETDRPFVSMMSALVEHCTKTLRYGARIGVLTSDHVRRARLFDTEVGRAGFTILHPSASIQAECV